MADKKLLPAFALNQHRRRVSLPTIPPETPVRASFGIEPTAPSVSTSGPSIYPDSPPATPTRVSFSKPAQGQALPTHTGRQPSRAYAHHRRISTARILRLASACEGPIPTPTKVVILFLIVVSSTYLSSFLPGSLSLLLPSRLAGSHTPATYYSPSSITHDPKDRSAAQRSTIGEAAQRRAWEESLPYRLPPQQHTVPVNLASGAGASHDGELFRAHPELLAKGVRPPRRRPLRMAKEADDLGASSGPDSSAAIATARAKSDSYTFSDDTSRYPRRPTIPTERQVQLSRMKKIAIAKSGNARVGVTAPTRSAEFAKVDDRVIVEGGTGRKRKLRKGKNGVSEEGDELALKENIVLKKGNDHTIARAGKRDPKIDEAALEQGRRTTGAPTGGISEDWTAIDDADEGDE
ncbi:hypothetical protein JCM1841_002789 [Sporobolomyces salmonicolor]